MTLLNDKIKNLAALGRYMEGDSAAWIAAKERAVQGNQWFTPEHIDLAAGNIAGAFLQEDKLQAWMNAYTLSTQQKTAGITMAGNIPLVGFHDFLCAYLSGHKALLKYASKDQVLLPHLLEVLAKQDPGIAEQVQAAEQLKNCDAYIATGSNNSARYFEQYFARYPHIIRRNRTSVAILDGTETPAELQALADDVFLYFGLGCRNVTQVCVPEGYDFAPLFEAFWRYKDLINHHKYRNNYDYYLAIYLLNKVPYRSNDAVLLVQNDTPFSAVSVLHYRYYTDRDVLFEELKQNNDLQCIVGKAYTPFGRAQVPALEDYADGVDTMAFLCSL
ncbi:MAG: acyl-CoA reductase [Chitinophagaceae bacterium]|nr:acyl-CoA reductase [Chitinophagaceae bacterium]